MSKNIYKDGGCVPAFSHFPKAEENILPSWYFGIILSQNLSSSDQMGGAEATASKPRPYKNEPIASRAWHKLASIYHLDVNAMVEIGLEKHSNFT